ncbi:MAG: hypothetical protein AAF721_00420 [Myxococcota bacterium]
MPVLTTLSSFSTGTTDGSGSDSTTRVVREETGALADGVPYLVLFSGGAICDGTASFYCECDLQFGSTEYAVARGGLGSFDPPNGPRMAILSGAVIITGNGTDTVTIGTRRVNGSAGNEVMWSGGGVKAIPLDQLLVDRHYFEAAGENSTTADTTPAAGAAYTQLGESLQFTAQTTGRHLLFFSFESQHQSDAGTSDAVRCRYRQTTDPDGSPTTVTLGGGDNSGNQDPALQIYARSTTPDSWIGHFKRAIAVDLTAGTEYEFFIEVDSPSGGGNTEYRRERIQALDAAVWAGGILVDETTIGQQPLAGTAATFGPLTIPDPPGADSYEYTFVAGTSFHNNFSWNRATFDLDGTTFPATGGWGAVAYTGGLAADDDYFFVSGLAEATVSAEYDLSFEFVSDNLDSPFGYDLGESGGESTDPAIATQIIAWRMETILELNPLDSTLPLPAADFSGTTTSSGPDVSGSLAADLPIPTASLSGAAATTGALDGELLLPVADFAGEAANTGTLAASLLLPVAAFVGGFVASGPLNASLPVAQAALVGEVATAGVLSADLPLLEADLDGSAGAAGPDVAGSVGADLPVPTAAFAGSFIASGALGSILPVPAADLSGSTSASGPDVTGAFSADLAIVSAALAGAAATTGVVGSTLPAVDADFAGGATRTGALDADLPLPTAGFAGTRTILGALDAALLLPTSALAGVAATTHEGSLLVSGTGSLSINGTTSSTGEAEPDRMTQRLRYQQDGQSLSHVPEQRVATATFELQDLMQHETATDYVLASGNATIDSFSSTLAAAAGPSEADPRSVSLASVVGITVGDWYQITDGDGLFEIVRVVGVDSANNTITLAHRLTQPYPITVSTVIGVTMTAAIPDAVSTDAARVDFYEPLRIVWTYAGRTHQQPVRVVRYDEDDVMIADLVGRVKTLWPGVAVALQHEGRDLVPDKLREAKRLVHTRLRREKTDPYLRLTGDLRGDAILFRFFLNEAAQGNAPAAQEDWLDYVRGEYESAFAALSVGEAGVGSVKVNRQTQSATGIEDGEYKRRFSGA